MKNPTFSSKYMEICHRYSIFAVVNHKRMNVMLGFDSKRTLVKGQFAREIRARIRRIQSKQLNDADRREIQSHRQYSNGMSIEWQ